MTKFKFSHRVHGSDRDSRIAELASVQDAENYGRGILAGLELAGLRDGDYLSVENEAGELVLILKYDSLLEQWFGELDSQGL